MTNKRYGKIDLLVKTSRDELGITKISFENCWYDLTNNHFIISEEVDGDTTHRVFKLDEISSFKTSNMVNK